jgi:ribosomal protein S8
MTSKHGYINFLQQIISAYNSGKSFFVVNNHKKSFQLASMFKKLGIVKSIKSEDFNEIDRYFFRIAKKRKVFHIIVWLQYNEFIPNNTSDFVSPIQFSPHDKPQAHFRPFHRIIFTRKQSRINFSSKLSSNIINLFYKPKVNVIHIIETPQGLIISFEASKKKKSRIYYL